MNAVHGKLKRAAEGLFMTFNGNDDDVRWVLSGKCVQKKLNIFLN